MLAQNRAVLRPDGTLKGISDKGDLREVLEVSKIQPISVTDDPFNVSLFKTTGLIDTFAIRDNWSGGAFARFGYYGQDWMLMWFEAPTDMTLKAVGFSVSPDDGPNVSNNVEVKVVSVNWTKDQLSHFMPAAKLTGYYEAEGNGYNDVTSLYSNPDRTGDWVVVDSTFMTPVFGEDLWSDEGVGAPVTIESITPPGTSTDPYYYWVEMMDLFFEPTFVQGDIFAIAIKNVNATMDDYVTRLWAYNAPVFGGWKFYANGRLAPGSDYGWWYRGGYDWDLVAAVDITGDMPPEFTNVTALPTTLQTTPQTVEATITDTNPSGGPVGVASADLMYALDGDTNYTAVSMVNTSGDIYSADIPGQSPGTLIEYYVTATDVNGNTSRTTATYNYTIFEPKELTLLVFNGYAKPTGYPQIYYFGHDDFTGYSTYPFDHDTWCYGSLTEELVNYYDNILEIATTGPTVLNSAVIRTWLEASGDHNYMLAGDEWLGAQTGWVDQVYTAGSFQYDILGIAGDYNDVNYFQAGDDVLPSPVLTVPGSFLGGVLHTLAADSSVDSMMYDPYYEITVTNWLDGVVPVEGTEVDLMALKNPLKVDPVQPDTVNICIHRTLAAGNKIAFLAYDPLSLNAAPSQYYWFGFSETAPQVQVLKWFGCTVGIEDEIKAVPSLFKLSQNYPNPFNPVTKIEYTIAKTAKVELKVYDVLGKEVATLVNEVKNNGAHTVEFNASQLSSGLYFYKIKSGSFTCSKKMLLIK
jgi:hypothetical protein